MQAHIGLFRDATDKLGRSGGAWNVLVEIEEIQDEEIQDFQRRPRTSAFCIVGVLDLAGPGFGRFQRTIVQSRTSMLRRISLPCEINDEQHGRLCSFDPNVKVPD